jgi:hypothetical protein
MLLGSLSCCWLPLTLLRRLALTLLVHTHDVELLSRGWLALSLLARTHAATMRSHCCLGSLLACSHAAAMLSHCWLAHSAAYTVAAGGGAHTHAHGKLLKRLTLVLMLLLVAADIDIKAPFDFETQFDFTTIIAKYQSRIVYHSSQCLEFAAACIFTLVVSTGAPGFLAL